MAYVLRVVRRTSNSYPISNDLYTIYEVFDEEGRVTIGDRPITPASNSVEGLRAELEAMLKAVDRPVMDMPEEELHPWPIEGGWLVYPDPHEEEP